MTQARKSATVYFSAKGRVVIPRWLRKEFEIEKGTRACVQSTPQGILITPVTATSIRRLRGSLKRKPGHKPFAEEWAKHKAEEKALEEARYARTTGSQREARGLQQRKQYENHHGKRRRKPVRDDRADRKRYPG